MMNQGMKGALALPWPVVFYTGREPYNQPTRLVDLFSESMREAASETLLGSPMPAFQLIELRLVPDEDLMADEPDVLSMLMKHVHDAEMAPTFQKLHPHLRGLSEGIEGKDCQTFVEAAFLYALYAGNTDHWKDVILPIAEDCLKPNRVEGLMTTAEKLKFEGMQQGVQQGIQQGVQQGIQQGMQQGIQQGVQQGKLEVACGMLSEGIPSATIAKVAKLSPQQMQQLKQDSH